MMIRLASPIPTRVSRLTEVECCDCGRVRDVDAIGSVKQRGAQVLRQVGYHHLVNGKWRCSRCQYAVMRDYRNDYRVCACGTCREERAARCVNPSKTVHARQQQQYQRQRRQGVVA